MGKHYSKRERLKYVYDYVRWKLGLFGRFQDIDYSRVERVVFVCAGNICRSAYADVCFSRMGGCSASLGIRTKGGAPADATAIRIARCRAVDLTSHLSTGIEGFQRRPGDLFACMSIGQATVTEKAFGSGDHQILLLGTLVKTPTIHDPYGRPSEFFEAVFDQLDAALHVLVTRIKLPAGEPERSIT